MPEIGEIISSKKLGLKHKSQLQFIACPDCGSERWIRLDTIKRKGSKGGVCPKCRGKRIADANTNRHVSRITREKIASRMRGANNPQWKGGKVKNSAGYFELWVHPNDFFAPMRAKTGRVKEHRLVMAKHFQRCLAGWETVHHKDGNKENNDISNLLLVTDESHHRMHALEQVIEKQSFLILKLENKIDELTIEIAKLTKGEKNAMF